jgi:lipopolysaccharide transport system ATP-binding protein
VVGIIGNNGAGKSTLLKILSRITAPSGGEVAVRGRVSSLLEVGTGFHPELTGRENVFLNGAILGMTRREVQRKFDELVSFAGVERFIDTPVKHYSSGMYMRLAFAIAAHLETDVLLVDEVLAVGDAAFQQKCLAKMRDVAGQGRTVLFVSHNMTAVQSMCRRVIHLEKGGIKAEGNAAERIQDYLSSIALKRVQNEPLRVGESLTIVVSLSPNPVESGNDLGFEIAVKAERSVELREVAFIIYALEGSRIGTVDLRSSGFPFSMVAGDRLQINGILRSVPLVEKQYRVALWVDSGAFIGELTDVVDLIVAPRTKNEGHVPPRPEVRGWVAFDTKCSSKLEHRLQRFEQARRG